MVQSGVFGGKPLFLRQSLVSLRLLALGLVLILFQAVWPFAGPEGAQAQTTPPMPREAGFLKGAMGHAARGDWDAAHVQAAQAGAIAQAIIQWQALRAGEGDLAEYLAFLEDRGHWPLINTVQRQAEGFLPDLPAPEVISFAERHTLLTLDGVLAHVMALDASGARDAAQALARDLWVNHRLDADAEAELDARFGPALRALDAARLDMLLWHGDRAGARRQILRVDASYQALARARLGVQEGIQGVDGLVAAVPAELANDPGLMHDRFGFRMRARNYDGAEALLIAQSRDPKGLGQPDAWARNRVFLVRSALGNGAYQRAYDLATPHGLDDGVHYADLEWMAGFIALEFLDRPETALGHFRALRVRVNSPISMGRAGYWEGRALEAMGDMIGAQAAYEFGAEHQSSYYGQLAADRLGMSLDPALLARPEYPAWEETVLAGSDLLQAALLLHSAGEWHEARRFVLFLARQLETEAELGALADLMLALDEPNFALNIAKIAVQSEIVLPRAYFPLTDLAQSRFTVPMDLVKAIARRESEFDPAVISPADARGLMQVLPGTGQMMARKLDVAFDAGDLTRDPVLNARLGAAYLEDLRAEFGPSLALVASGYNAGPGRPRQWIERLGDPRDPEVDFVTWVERVPFAETRNYIMRVAESLVVYRSLLAGSPQPIAMEALIRGK